MATAAQEMANLRRALNTIRNNQNAETVPVETTVAPIVQHADDLMAIVPAVSNLSRIVNFLSRPIVPIQKRYTETPLAITRTASVEHWTDLAPGPRVCYNLIKYDTAAEICQLGNEVFESLRGTITARAVCQLLLLAYNLKDTANNDCFGVIPAGLIGENMDTDFNEIPDDVIAQTYPTANFAITIAMNPNDPNDTYERVVGNCYCYLAATYLRLFTKSAVNYTRIGAHIRERYKNFFKHDIVFENFEPTSVTIQTIKSQFEINPVIKNTFYNLIYAGEATEVGKSLKDFLYVMHVQYTGMHCYLLFFKCMEALKIDNRSLLDGLYSNYFSTELNAMDVMFNRFFNSSNTPGMGCQMWRFARVFDNSFMNQLQTKNCAAFTAMLAYLYHGIIPPQGNSDARKISRVTQLHPDILQFAEAYAFRARMVIMGEQFEGGNFAGIEETVKPAAR